MKIYIQSIFLVLGSYGILLAQNTGSIRGKVTNAETRENIPGAEINILKAKLLVIKSNEDGVFVINDIVANDYDVECSAPGYITQRILGVRITENHAKLTYFKLQPGNTEEAGVDIVGTYASLKNTLNTKVTTISRTAEPLLDAPATAYIITDNDIENRGYMSLADVLEDIPEIEIQDKSDPEYFNLLTVRGITGNEKLLILMDGIRINSMSTTKHAVDKNFSIRHAKRIEVVLGPASALYGADAFTAVVNIITPNGDKLNGVEATASYGMFNSSDNTIHLGFGNRKMSVALTGSFYNSDEPVLPNFYKDDYAWYHNNYLPSGEIGLTPFVPGLTDTIAIQPYTTPRQAYSFHAKLSAGSFELGILRSAEQYSSTTGAPSEYYPAWKEALFGISLTNVYASHLLRPKEKDSKWSLKSDINWNYYEVDADSRFINTYSSYENAYKFGFNNDLKIRETFTYAINKQHSLLGGLSFQYTHSLPRTSDLPKRWQQNKAPAEQGLYYVGTNIMDKDSNDLTINQEFYYYTQLAMGSFVQYQGNFGKALSLTLGGRIDFNTRNTNDKNKMVPILNPRVGLVVKPTEAIRIKAFYGEAFLQPSPEKAYEHYGAFFPVTDSTGGITGLDGAFWKLPNSDLKPEKIRSVELNASFTKNKFSLFLGGYYNSVLDLISDSLSFAVDFNGVEIDAVLQPVNSSSAYSYGGTFRGDYKQYFGKDQDIELGAYASYSFSDGRVDKLLKLPLSAMHTIKAGFLFRYKGFSISPRLIFRTQSVGAGLPDSEGAIVQQGNTAFALLNVYAKYRVLDNSKKEKKNKLILDLFVRGRNITNARYYNVTLNNVAYFRQSPQDPIRIMGGLSLTFGKG